MEYRLKELLNRELNIGDFVLDVSKSPVSINNYGLVVSNDSIFIDNKIMKKKGLVYKIINPDIQERQIFSNLLKEYHEYNNSLLLKSKIISDIQYDIGDAIESSKIKEAKKVGLYLGFVNVKSLNTNYEKSGYGYIIDRLDNFQYYKDSNSSFDKMMYLSYSWASHHYNEEQKDKIYMINKYFKLFSNPIPGLKTSVHLNINMNYKYDGKVNGEVLTFLGDNR